MKKAFPKGVGSRMSTLRSYVATLVGVTSWKVALALALALCVSLTQGAQLLLLVPLMSLAGLEVQQGSVGWLNELASSLFAVVGARPSLIPVLGAFALFSIVLALLSRWRTTYSYKLQEDLVSYLRRRLYRAIANVEWLVFTRSRSSDFTHALTTEIDRIGAAYCSAPKSDHRRDIGTSLRAACFAVIRGHDHSRVRLWCRAVAGAQQEDADGPMDW
jgi:hypothetical protein